MLHYLLLALEKFIAYRQIGLAAFVWIARFGYLVYVLYGLVEWCRPGAVRERLYRRRTMLYCLAAVSAASVVSACIGRLWPRHRPFVRDRSCLPLIPHKENASFPSNHAMNSMAVSLVLLGRHCGLGLPLLAYSLLLGASRVVCRLHYASDVLGGFALGAISAVAVLRSRIAREGATQILWVYGGLANAAAWWRRFVRL